MSRSDSHWHSVALAVACLALDPFGIGGLYVRARVGPVRDRLETALKRALQGQTPRRLTAQMSDDALYGGIDLASTLQTGSLIRSRGVLDGSGICLLPMAERVDAGLAGRLSRYLDMRRDVALIAFDEGAEPGEQAPSALKDRLALHLDLTDLAVADAPEMDIDLDALVEARARLPGVKVPGSAVTALTSVAAKLGISSLRAPIHALAVARTLAALSGPDSIDEPDILTAIELVLAPRATLIPDLPQEEDTEAPCEPNPEPDTSENTAEGRDSLPPPEVLLAAAKAMLPDDLLARLVAAKARSAHGAQGSGAPKSGNRRGRPLPPRAGRIDRGARVDLVATLRAAAPWQPMRRRASGLHDRIHIRMSDIRLRQFQEKSDRAIIFVVDASGSAAMARLAEAKGAVELLLAEAYARRDHVALVAFRGEGSDVLLPPTRSLVQTKRRLASLPGGGGTPLASGLKSALELADLARGKGLTPSVALLTDGRANVDLSGQANRKQASEDASALAHCLRAKAMPSLVIDTGARPTQGLDQLAREMGAPYVPLPRADSRSLSRTVDAALGP